MKLSWTRAIQWVGILAVLVFVVALRYEAPSEAGMQMNASPDSPLSQSLRGYWKLDDGSGTNATDSSGNSNTLAMTGSPSWVTGNIGPYALDFSGSGQYLSVADPSSGVLDFVDGADFTISGWFNRDTAAADHTIVAKKNDQTTSAGYVVWIDNNGSTDYLSAEISDGTDTYSAIGATDLSTTGWHHFSVVWDDSNGLFIYLDGKLDGSTTSSTTSINDLSNALAFRIGAESDAGVPFDGKIDDVRIYGYALSADQVKKIYQTTAPTQPVDTSLVGHWTFDGTDIQGTTAIDRSSFGNNGTITGATKTIGKLGQALSFNGGSDEIGTAGPSLTTTYTLSLWIYPTAGNVGSFHGLIMEYYSGLYYIRDTSPLCNYINAVDLHDTSERCNNTHLGDNQWHHIVVVNSAGAVTFYLNGTPDGTATGGMAFDVGSIGSGFGGYFAGKIDDVRVYNRALSATEVADLYNMGK